jgi:mRNA-degrading endonuclease RelE of RelBE toxin-antitoxin system
MILTGDTVYGLKLKPEADRIFEKLKRKNPRQLEIISRKLRKIQENPHHEFKFLRFPLQTFNRVHIDGSFVLIFRIDREEKVVDVHYLGHHDEVYAWRPLAED